MKPVLASLSLLLVACSAPQPSGSAAAPGASAAAPVAAAPGSVAMGKRVPGDVALPLQVFRVFGNEPFWNAAVEGDRLTYSTPDDPAGVVLQGRRRAIPGGVEIAGSHDGRPFVLTVIEDECSDGMSGNNYPLAARFRFGDVDFGGCGEAAK
ncbi:MAG TPA: hypothetical protein VGE09_12555 [Pseudoxanthomonas sp.]|jgi:uncharacterized membrane protein|uniref:COG3650 family protein n=1 Tax=Thermomonas sp. XSG TaxID=2771436 RepID=UPI00086842C5|nr:hypothetical protein [Thermomonas sp. XSG]ODU52111.1 MAG: hypothetical protein ABS98_04925 [Xanthomonadaceae bacterium SCN 69-48]QNU14507.1 hypothetical protein ICG51_000755 [Thermomonas sp. XSG]